MVSNFFNEENINPKEKAKYFVQPGYIFVSKEPHLLSTVLGSCVSICIWDSLLGFGGMNHYVHAKPFKKEQNAKFGSISIPHLINTMIKFGSQKYNLKGHIVGGSQSLAMQSSLISKENIKLAETLFKEYYIDILTFDIGGELGRKIIFDTATGEILIYKVTNLRESDWYADKSFNN